MDAQALRPKAVIFKDIEEAAKAVDEMFASVAGDANRTPSGLIDDYAYF